MSDKLFIKTQNDYEKILKMPCKYVASFICAKCGALQTYHVNIIRRYSWPCLCRICRRKSTNLEKYGCESIQNLESIKCKKKNTLQKHYGDNPYETISKKRIQTVKEKYGVENVMQMDETKEKMKTTCKEKYGEEHFSKTIYFKEKIKNTSLSHFGTEFPSQSDEIKEKIKNTCTERYGGHSPFCDETVREKAKNSCLKKYGASYPMSLNTFKDKMKDTHVKKYNGIGFSSEQIQEKIKETCLERYGVEHPMQNHEIFCKTKKKYEYDGLMFDSKPEIEFYKKLKDENADFEYQPDIFFEYEYEGKTHKYYPDFRIGNEYVELKGAYFFKDGKMINPYNNAEDALYEAKHQCMIKNGIKIIIV